MLRLLQPSLDLLPSYRAALERGWSFDSHRMPEAIREELADIARDPRDFVARQTDREAHGPPIVLPDGSQVPRLPGYRLWMWDGELCGVVSFRWKPGTHELPSTCLGHIGYGVVPWKRRMGYATRALSLLRPSVRDEGFAHVDIVADVANRISRKVITANGGFAFERFVAPESCGGADCLRFRWYTGAPFPRLPCTERLLLRQWNEADRAPLAAMNADPRVMEHFPARLSRRQSDALLDRLREAIARRGWGLWAVEGRATGAFLGFVGLAELPEELPSAPAIEVGWRLIPQAWGAGYATEAAREALSLAFDVLHLPQVVSYTAATNIRSMAVMQRLGMHAAESFEHPRIRAGHRLRTHRVFRLSREEYTARTVPRSGAPPR